MSQDEVEEIIRRYVVENDEGREVIYDVAAMINDVVDHRVQSKLRELNLM